MKDLKFRAWRDNKRPPRKSMKSNANDYWSLWVCNYILADGAQFDRCWQRHYARRKRKLERRILADFSVPYPEYKREYLKSLLFKKAEEPQ